RGKRNPQNAAGGQWATSTERLHLESVRVVERPEPCADGLTPADLTNVVEATTTCASTLARIPDAGAWTDAVAAVFLALVTANAELCDQLSAARDLLMETAIDAGQLHVGIEAVPAERDAWHGETERLQRQLACELIGSSSVQACYNRRSPTTDPERSRHRMVAWSDCSS
uniref:hypothetical protein n=1 Tax=Methylobacterium sp. B34 TaxID=95563 RepID=UPI00195527F1